MRYLRSSGLFPAQRVNIEVSQPQERSLTDEEMELLRTLAGNDGYESVAAMVKAWNASDPEEVSEQIDDVLGRLLKSDRAVGVSINARKPAETEVSTRVHSEQVCVVPVREVTTRRVKGEPWEATLPWPVVIPAVMPRRKPRREGV